MNKDFVDQFEVLLNGCIDPVVDSIPDTFNYEGIYPTNCNMTAINYLPNNVCSSNQEPYLSLEQALNNPGNDTTSNDQHIVMPPPISNPYSAANHKPPIIPVQNPESYHIANPATSQEPNWEAIIAYLQGQIRPGPERVFQCAVCGSEYINAQALGGHMRCHSKKKKKKKKQKKASSIKTRRFKKARYS